MVGVVNGKWTVNGKTYRYLNVLDRELLSRVMSFQKEAYYANHKPKQIKWQNSNTE